MPFADLIGQEAALRILKNQLAAHRLASTYLFSGLSGIGKRTLALEFAKTLLCPTTSSEETKPAQDACGQCESCKKVDTLTHPELMLVEPETASGQVGIDQIRALESRMNLSPLAGSYKVGILDGAESMTEQTTHACLKLLEEPPDRTIFILLSATPFRLPQTLLSRCHRLNCVPQGTDKVAAFLAKQEGLPPDSARMISVAAGGRIGLALAFHRSGELAQRNQLLDQLLSAMKKSEPEIPLAKVSKQQLEVGLEWLAAWWRDLLLLKSGGSPEWVIHQDRLSALQQAAPTAQIGPLLARLERVYEAQAAIERNVLTRNVLASLLVHG